MKKKNNASIGLALEALTKTAESIDEKRDGVSALLSVRRTARRSLIQAYVKDSLPDLGEHTLSLLEKDFAGFMSKELKRYCAQAYVFFGFFKTNKYSNILTGMRAKFAQYLESSPQAPADLQELTDAVKELTERQKTLDSRHNEVMGMVQLLTRALKGEVTFPKEVQEHINQIASKSTNPAPSAPSKHASQPSTRYSSSSTSYHSSSTSHRYHDADLVYVYDDDSDLWFNYFTGIPTSLRTMMLDSMIQQPTAAPSYRYDAPTDYQAPPSQQDSYDARSDTCVDTGGGNQARVDFAYYNPASSSIATDDRLGAFS